MSLSRRNFLALAGAGVVAAAVDVGALGTRVPGAFATTAAVADTPGRGLFGGLTTLDRTVVKDLATANSGGYVTLAEGVGEPHIVREDLAQGRGYAHPTLSLGAFVQITDLQIVDDQSPLRVEFTDRLADLPNSQGYETDSAYRPQEFLTTHIVEAMTRAIRSVGKGPMTGLPLAFTIATGDMVDNVQYNETRWYIDLLDGGHTIRADSGAIGQDQSVSSFFGDNNTGVHNAAYWYPEAHSAMTSGVDNYQRTYGFPAVAGLLSAARRPYTSTGLGMPWYAAMGNHDGEIQGNYPIHVPSKFSAVLYDLRTRAVGGAKPWNSGTLLDVHPAGFPGLLNLGDFIFRLNDSPVVADTRRRILDQGAFANEHFTTTTLPNGHGFWFDTQRMYTYYAIPSADTDLIQYITLDTVNYDGGANGRLTPEQFFWLEDRLKANSSQYIKPGNTGWVTQPGVKDKLFVIFAHHTIDSTNNSATNIFDVGDPDFYYGVDLERLLLRYPNVILMVVGHTHRNTAVSHARGSQTSLGNSVMGDGGFWEISTASHIDWPAQSRVVEIAAGAGTISIFTTMVDIDSPLKYAGDLSNPSTLASLARELAANDPTERTGPGHIDRRGGAYARNTQLVVWTPFVLPWPEEWGSSIAVGRNTDGRLELFGTNGNDEVWQRDEATTTPGSWTNWARIAGSLRAVAMEANADGRLAVFGVNGVGNVCYQQQISTGGWTGFTSLAGSGETDHIARSITAARNDNGTLEVFITTPSNDVWHTWQVTHDSGTWAPWSKGFGRSTVPFAKVAAERNKDGQVELFATAVSGSLWRRAQLAAGGWTDWTVFAYVNVAYFTAIVVARNATGRLGLFGIDSDWRVWTNTQAATDAAPWTGWVLLDDGQTRMTQITARANRNGTLELFGVDCAGQLWNRRQTAASATTYTPWVRFSGALRADVPVPPPGSTIANPPPTPVIVPQVVGLTRASAKSRLESYGLKVGSTGRKTCQNPQRVLEQTPVDGTVVQSGATVQITYDSGTVAECGSGN